MESRFTKQQKMVLAGIVISYTAAYLCRLNLSAALSSIASAFTLSDAQAGMLQTCFAVVYAAGQLINGAVVDRVSPVRHMLLGMMGFICVNLLMSTVTSFPALMALCMCNGVFQSMLWTPIVRLMALHFDTYQKRSTANVFVSLTLVAGHFMAWAISGFMAKTWSWRMSFSAPACVGLVCFCVVCLLFRHVRAVKGTREAASGSRHVKRIGVWPMLVGTGFAYILLACVLYGFVRDGIVTWAPTLITAMQGGSADATWATLIIPLINLLGVWASRFFGKHGHGKTRLCMVLLLLLAACFCAPLTLVQQLLLTAVLMGFGCASMYGLTPIVTAMIPLEYDRVGRIGLAAGLVDGFIYLGSALAGVLGGTISQYAGPRGLYLAWMAAALLAALLAFLSSRRKPMQTLAKYSADVE